LRPDYAEAHCNRAVTLKDLDQLDDALAGLDRALLLRPDYVEAIYNRGAVLKELKRTDAALAAHERVLALQPDHPHAFSAAAECVLHLCDWGRLAKYAPGVKERAAGGGSIIDPLTLLGYSDDPALQLQCARRYFASIVPQMPPPLWSGGRWRHDRLKIAYFSADFRSHPVTQLTAGLYEMHDRDRFEVIAISCGRDDRSEQRARVMAAVDEFHDVRSASDRDIAKLMNEMQVDIAVDLSGYTGDGRSAVLAHRPAPVQVSYLGFSATMGTNLIDYIVADPVLLPSDLQQHFAEKIVHLPDCYQVSDSRQKIAATPSRSEAGLPETGFVFCCFNNNWKLAPEVFDIWMRLLHAVPGSVLWLSSMNATAMGNVRRAAEARGVPAERVIFAKRLDHLADHLARHRLADLFLDTFPYNAHTTTNDALRAGLPVVTRIGGSYAARVAASLVTAIGLPELVTTSLDEYEALARDLATNPRRLAAVKAALAVGRDTGPLFDTARFTRHLEAAYITMWETWQRGETPKSFSVAPLDWPVS
jgi:predicted O-linked N-acetylglucosamine transferase (SPINDLY family)